MSHDYDPNWDYEVRMRPLPAVKAQVEAAKSLVAMFSALLGLAPPTYHYVADTGDHLARYVNGTATAPVVVVNDKMIAATAKRYGVPMRTAVESTLLHEMGHAYVDSVGMAWEWDDEEEIVEAPARAFFRNGDIEGAAQFLIAVVEERLADDEEG
jgi:hypothetical protein